MKAAAFEYVRAQTVEHALEVLAQNGGEARLLAGGMSLVPMMAMRMARPSVLVDINRLVALKSNVAGESPATHVTGSGLRQRDMEESADIAARLPLVRAALHWVGHSQTRNRGTVGGSLVHADPSAELPLAAAVLGATLVLSRYGGAVRRLPAAGFFLGPMFTVIEDDECLTAIEWPVWSGTGVACAFEELSIRHGDFAIASAACQVQLDPQGRCRRAAVGIGGADGVPRAFPELAARLEGRPIDVPAARDIARAAAAQCEPGSDVHADAAYRRHVAAVLLERALANAARSAALSQ